MTRALLFLVAAACGSTAKPPPPEKPVPQVPRTDLATVPLHVEGNRPYVDLTFRKADGSTKIARFLVDSGGGGFLIVEPLAKELGLALGETLSEEGATFAQVSSPMTVTVGDVALALDPKRVLVLIGQTTMVPKGAPGHADGMLPGHVLAKYHVVFDYPKATFTIAKPGVLKPEGKAMPMPVSPKTGFPRTELEIDGKTHGFLLDTGASFTMVSQTLLETWGTAHADWERHKGAHGDAATLGGQTLETMYLPAVTWGGHALAKVGVTSQRAGTFEEWMSKMMTAPIVGSLAGNVLTKFRVELDYPNQTLYLTQPVRSSP
jgi:predicted aspartyl protease